MCVSVCLFLYMFHVFYFLLLWAKLAELNVMMMIADKGVEEVRLTPTKLFRSRLT